MILNCFHLILLIFLFDLLSLLIDKNFHVDPNDPTKAIFVKSDSFEHRFDGRGLQPDAITILQKHGFYDDYKLNIGIILGYRLI